LTPSAALRAEEDSPAIHRWGQRTRETSPGRDGRTQVQPTPTLSDFLSSLSGLRPHSTPLPAMNRWAILGRPVRDWSGCGTVSTLLFPIRVLRCSSQNSVETIPGAPHYHRALGVQNTRSARSREGRTGYPLKGQGVTTNYSKHTKREQGKQPSPQFHHQLRSVTGRSAGL